MRVATYPGSAHGTICHIVRAHGHELRVARTLRDADALKFDALLLAGGADISPRLYGERRTLAGVPDRGRDMVEWALVRKALTRGLPILGICRGHQMLAVACGGALYQDMYEAKVAKPRHQRDHGLMEVKSPLLSWLPMENGRLSVNSYHHQAVKVVPAGFKVVARCDLDGVIEAIWRPGCLGVQWHPEMLYPDNPRWRGLFEWFFKGLGA